MNYFKLLNIKEEELNVLKEKLKEVNLKVNNSQDYFIEMLDQYKKEQELLENLAQYYLEEQTKESIKCFRIIFGLLSLGSLFIFFNLWSNLELYFGLGLLNIIELGVTEKIKKILFQKYQDKRNLKEREIKEQTLLIQERKIIKDQAKENYLQSLKEQNILVKDVAKRSLELDNLRNNILKAFYPFLINLCEEEKIEDNLDYQQALKRIRKLNIKELE